MTSHDEPADASLAIYDQSDRAGCPTELASASTVNMAGNQPLTFPIDPRQFEVNMAPINPHCFHSPDKARTPSPRSFFSVGKFPNQGTYAKIYTALMNREDPWYKPPAAPSSSADATTDAVKEHEPVVQIDSSDSEAVPPSPDTDHDAEAVMIAAENFVYETPKRMTKAGWQICRHGKAVQIWARWDHKFPHSQRFEYFLIHW